ncbi:MAG: hypothetical protein ACOYX1_01235 [Acidobacteriota bacterium]
MAEALAAVTVAAANYLPQAAAIAASLRHFHPETPLYVVLAGSRRRAAGLERLGARVVMLDELRVEGLRGMMLRYGPKELCAALKPCALRAVFDAGHRTAVFLDPDTLVLASLEPCFRQASEHALMLTPHMGPEAAERPDEGLERALLMAGMFNGGFVGASDCGEARRFLEWWAKRLRWRCFEDVEAGMHYDQRWLDLAPGFVADLHVCRDPGCNAAYWRLGWAAVERRGGDFLLGGRLLRLFHFSGYDPAAPDFVTKFRPGWRVEETGAGAALFRLYQARLLEAGWRGGAECEPDIPETYRVLHLVRRARLVLRRAAARWRSR